MRAKSREITARFSRTVGSWSEKKEKRKKWKKNMKNGTRVTSDLQKGKEKS